LNEERERERGSAKQSLVLCFFSSHYFAID
jgi:hypothetical protein